MKSLTKARTRNIWKLEPIKKRLSSRQQITRLKNIDKKRSRREERKHTRLADAVTRGKAVKERIQAAEKPTDEKRAFPWGI